MNNAFRQNLQGRLDNYREWALSRSFSKCRLVHYCGVDLVGSRDVPLDEVASQIEGLVWEGFRVDWSEHEGRLYLRVWESVGPEPDWEKVIAGLPLADISELLRRIE